MPRAKKNPALVIFGNPGRGRGPRRQLLGEATAIVYRHAETNELMVHAFGPHGEQIQLESSRSSLTIRRLPTGPTGVAIDPEHDGSVRIWRPDGRPIWKDFD